MPRTGSTEFCRQLTISLIKNRIEAYYLGEFFNMYSVSWFGNIRAANTHFNHNNTPCSVDVLQIKDNLLPADIEKIQNLDSRFQVLEITNLRFVSSDDLKLFVHNELSRRVKFLKYCHNAGKIAVIKHFNSFGSESELVVKMYKEHVSSDIMFFYRKNLNAMFFSLAFKKQYLDSNFLSNITRLDSNLINQYGDLGHNFGKQAVLNPAGIMLDTNTTNLNISFKIFSFIQNNYPEIQMLSYELVFSGNKFEYTFNNNSYSMTILSTLEKKMNYGSDDKVLYFKNYNEVLKQQSQQLATLDASFVEKLGLHF